MTETDSSLRARLMAARDKAVADLLAARSSEGHWVGELSSSALSTATAVCALSLAGKAEHSSLIRAGLRWLAEHANPDGGWGDTDRSISNISTTTLVWAAFGVVPGAAKQYARVVERAEQWLMQRAGTLAPEPLAEAIAKRYGKDRTFSVPILTTCALAGRFGPAEQAWRFVPQLPFELAGLPHQWYSAVKLPVVSYALPALIAIGRVRHHFLPTRNPIARAVRNRLRNRTLDILTDIQPANGGFLEATPLTSFVTMSLAGMGLLDHPVTKRGVEFLKNSARPDGSWPIDTNLGTWVTTLSINAGVELAEAERPRLTQWLLDQQYLVEHPYTHAAPGGWAWTNLPGGVPDADDTAGALVALRALSPSIDQSITQVSTGIVWLLNLQNRDGGIPTFCRGWGALPFDRSGADLTAHALRAWLAWRDLVAADLRRQIDAAVQRAVRFLAATQRCDGSWLPLWFGHQKSPDDENPLYGTANVLSGLATVQQSAVADVTHLIDRGVNWLLAWQQADGGWSGARDGESSVEETALAITALAELSPIHPSSFILHPSFQRGLQWLIERVEDGRCREPSPIGFYFARLWYYEKLYPAIFATGALTRAASLLSPEHGQLR